MLTDEEKATAKALGLRFTEMSVALASRITPETYALRKQEIAASRDAWDAKMAEVAEGLHERLPADKGR